MAPLIRSAPLPIRFSQWRSNTLLPRTRPIALHAQRSVAPPGDALRAAGYRRTDLHRPAAVPEACCYSEPGLRKPTAVDELDATPATFVYPNPVTSRPAVLRFPTVASTHRGSIRRRGALVYRTSTRNQGNPPAGTTMGRGIYNVRAVSGSEAETVRLVVE